MREMVKYRIPRWSYMYMAPVRTSVAQSEEQPGTVRWLPGWLPGWLVGWFRCSQRKAHVVTFSHGTFLLMVAKPNSRCEQSPLAFARGRSSCLRCIMYHRQGHSLILKSFPSTP